MQLSVKTPADYQKAMDTIENYLAKGSVNLTKPDLAEPQRLSLLIERYEDKQYPMPI